MDTRALIRLTAPRKLRITLTAGPTAAAAARSEVRAAIRAWNIPVDASVAVLLTSELVANALRHGAGKAIELVVSCAYSQLQVDVYSTSPAAALHADGPAGPRTGHGPAGPRTGHGPTSLASLSDSCGHYRTPAGEAGFFTLMF